MLICFEKIEEFRMNIVVIGYLYYLIREFIFPYLFVKAFLW